MKGKMIVIEGSDGSGKETQGKRLVEALTKMGKKAIYLSFPMYDTPTGKIISKECLGREHAISYFDEGFTNVAPEVACLYYAADRKYNISKIMQYIDDGYYTVVDRYVSSNMAHQGGKIRDEGERFRMYQWIDKLEYWLLNLPKADITICLHVPYKVSLNLMKTRTFMDNAENDTFYLQNSETSFVELAGLYNWKMIECTISDEMRSIDDISSEILDYVLNFK